MKKLKFSDILWLDIISHITPPPSQREAARLYNEFLVQHEVGKLHLPIKGISKISEIVKTLRILGYITPAGKMEVTEKSNDLWEHVGLDWKQYPFEIPIENGRPVWEKAVK